MYLYREADAPLVAGFQAKRLGMPARMRVDGDLTSIEVHVTRSDMHISAPFIRRPVGTMLLTLSGPGGRGHRLPLPSGSRPSRRRFSYDSSGSGAARCESGNDGILDCHARGAAPRANRRGHRNDLDQHQLGSTSITLQFDLDRDIDAAARDVQAFDQRRNRTASHRSSQPAEL